MDWILCSGKYRPLLLSTDWSSNTRSYWRTTIMQNPMYTGRDLCLLLWSGYNRVLAQKPDLIRWIWVTDWNRSALVLPLIMKYTEWVLLVETSLEMIYLLKPNLFNKYWTYYLWDLWVNLILISRKKKSNIKSMKVIPD